MGLPEWTLLPPNAGTYSVGLAFILVSSINQNALSAESNVYLNT
jgi:hypothetical protein